MAAAMKHMASNFDKLEKFEGVDFRRRQKKMHFLLSSMNVVYVLTTPVPEEGGESPTVEQVRMKAKIWTLLWDTLEAKYMAKDASSKKFLVSNFKNYKITDSRPVLEQYNELLGILGSHLRLEESLRVQENDKPKSNNVAGPSVVNMVEHTNSFRYNDNKGKRKHHDARANPNKKPKVTCWKCGKPVHLKKDCKAGNVSNRANVYNTKGSEDGSSNPLKGQSMFNKSHQIYYVTYVSGAFFVQDDDATWWVDSGAIVHMSKDRCWAAVRLPDPKLKTLGERCIECIFVGYVEHSKALRFYFIEPNDSVAINFIIESRDAIFDEHRFSSVPRPSQRSLVQGTEESGGSVVSERVTDEIAHQSEPELRKSKRQRTPKDFGPEFQLYLIEGTIDLISDQYSYYFIIEDDPKTFKEAMNSQDVAFWKEAINDEIDSIMGNNTWVLTDLPPCCRPLGCKWIFKKKTKVDGTGEKFKARLVIQGFNQKSGIDYFDTYAPVARISTIRLLIAMASIRNLIIHQMDLKTAFLIGVSTPLDTCEKLMPNKGMAVSQLEYSRVIGCLIYAMTCTRPNIAFVVGKLSRYTSNPGTQHWQAIHRVLKYLKKTMNYRLVYSGYPSVLEGYTDAIWISNTKYNSSTSGWVFLLGGDAISWASKKQTCITGSTMESEFVALAAAGKEAKWLKNLLLEIPLWVKPITPISICCDSAATLQRLIAICIMGSLDI
uniref:Zinc finger, CCHC-type n=1 Tax=Tanacetum cinerariifolium TaxID=118510 RepID=A0A699GN46_TANCI|nr:zinc finger, CCHC-type [Tanacetum cinerariifolium]